MRSANPLRFLSTDTSDAALNLAIEEVLVNTDDGRDVVMLWRNDPVVVVGRHQNTELQVNRAYCEDHGIMVIRRLSGGGAVYHDRGNLCYTVITRGVERHATGFERFARPVIDALARLGVQAEFTGNDLMVGDKKFSGLAQYTRNTTLMQHGALLFNTDLSALGLALKPKLQVHHIQKPVPGVASHVARVTNLSEHLEVSFEDFCATLVACFTEGAEVEQQALSAEELVAATKRADSRYRRDSWNWGAPPLLGPEFSTEDLELA